MKKALRAVATLVAAGGAAAAIGLTAPAANADTPDERFLHMVHSNGVGGQDDSLIAFAHEYCNTNGPYMTMLTLFGQGVSFDQIYIVQVAALRTYCPDKGR